MQKKALVSLTVPGTRVNAAETPLMKEIEAVLSQAGIEANWVDTVSAWGCLNQNWLEFRADIDTSWGWCKVVNLESVPFFDSDDGPRSEELLSLCHHGQVLMQVHYIEEDGSFRPHR